MDTKELVAAAKVAVAKGDTDTFRHLLGVALENDMRRIEAQVIRRAEAVEAFRAEAKPESRYRVISLLGRKGSRLFVTGVSYKPGPGYSVSKISYTTDRSKAMTFSPAASEGISEYLICSGYSPRVEAF